MGDIDELAAFLGRMLSEDEARAFEVHNALDCASCGPLNLPCDCGYPARVRRDVEAKRAIIGDQTSDHAPVETQYGLCCRTCVDWTDTPVVDGGETEFGIAIPQLWPCKVARREAAVYSDRPGYKAEWAP